MTPNEQKKTVEMESIGESYTVWTHKSGLTVFHIPKNRSETYALLAVRFGSNDGRFRISENAPVTVLPDGTAHFLEHKMFEEPDGTDAFSLYAQSGAFANAFTSRDATCYLFSCTEGFEDNLRILLHSVTSPYFTKETVEKELDIIGEEIDMHACAPGETVHRNLLRALYHVCPVRNEIAGTRESISEMTPDLLYGCADAFYRPSNMSLTVVGNADPEAVDRICDEFLPAEGKPMTAETLPEEEPESVFQTRVEEESEIAQPLIAVGFKAPVPDSPERDMLVSAANAVNMQLLFSRSGDFFNRLYEQGVISERFGGDYNNGRNYAYTEIGAACDDPERFLEEVRNELLFRLDSYYQEEEFERAKRVVYANGIFPLDSVEDTAMTCSSFWVMGEDYLRWPEAVMRVTREEAHQILRETVRLDRCSVSILRPKGGNGT